MEFKVSKSCLFCGKHFSWNEVFIIKAPEGACFHINCSEKFPDDKKYTFPDAWLVHEYQGEQTFTTE